MPIVPEDSVMPEPASTSLSGFRPDVPPFPYAPAGPAEPYDRALHMQAVDLVSGFMHSSAPCMSKTFRAESPAKSAASAKAAASVINRVAPHGVTAVRRADTVYLLRR